MAVVLATHQMIARKAAERLESTMYFSTRVNRAREEEFTQSVNGYKKGATISVMVPPVPRVYDGATFAEGGTAASWDETTVALTLDTQKHVAISYTATEKLLEIDDFMERIGNNAVDTLGAMAEADLISRATKMVPNIVGIAGTTPTTARTWGQAKAMMDRYLAPKTDRTTLMSSEANVEMVDASKALFNPVPAISKMYEEGSVLGKFQGAVTFDSVNLASFGNVADIVMTVNGASQTGNVLTVSGAPGTPFLSVGMNFTLPGVYAVHPQSGLAYGTTLQQFTVVSATATTITIYPAITTSMPTKTVSASPTDTNALTFIGAASTAYTRSLMFHRDAFTVAFAPLPILASCEGYTTMAGGMSVRVMTFGNGLTDTENTRIDLLYGIAGVRPQHASQIIQ